MRLLSYNKWIIYMSYASKTQFFACLPILLAGWSFFPLVVGLSLIVSLAIGETESMNGEVATTFLNIFYERNWSAFLGVELFIMAFKYFLLQRISFMLLDSIRLVDGFLLC